MTRRGDPTKGISDTALHAFVLWSRLNSEACVSDPIVARGVLVAYALHVPNEPTAAEPDSAWIEDPLFAEEDA